MLERKSEIKSPIAQPMTKFIIPRIPVNYLRRSRLSKRFQDVSKHKIVLVTAPAGYGKTTSLIEALTNADYPVAWVSLNKRDDYVLGFWTNIIMAIRKIDSSLGRETLAILQNSEQSIELALTELINEIIARVPDLCIVLDDYHCIESTAVHNSLGFLMDYLPDQSHLIIAARGDPPLSLTRLRGQGYVAEIKTADLRFNIEETSEFLNEVMALSLSKENIKYIHSHTEGWIAGLQMILVTMQGNSEVNALLPAFSRSNQDIMEYLTSEVLDQQEEHVRQFLLETSIFDRFNAAMCDGILGRDDSQQILEILLARNLFLQPIDAEGKWFRYHSFFKDSLNKQLVKTRGETSYLVHARASNWFEQEGLIEDAIDHALEAGEFDRAITLFDKIATIFMGQDKFGRFWAWFDKLPQELISKSLWTNIGCAVAFEMTRQPEHQRLFTHAALSISETNINALHQSPFHYALLKTLQTLDEYHKGNILPAIEYAEQGLEAIPEDEARGRCGLLCVKGFSHWMNGQLMESYHCCREAAYLGKVVGWPYSVGLNLSAVAHIKLALGHLNSAAETCREIQSGIFQDGQEVSSSCYAYLILARILYQRNLLDEAEEQIHRAVNLSENGQEPVLWLCSQMALARIKIVRGRPDAAMEIARRAKITHEISYPRSILADIFITRLWIMLGDGSAAADCSRSWVGSLFSSARGSLEEEDSVGLLQRGIYGNDIRNVWAELPLLTYVRVKLLQGDLDGLSELLAKAHQDAETKQWHSILIETMILEALVLDAAGDPKTALNILMDAMALTQKEGQLRIFADEGQPLLQLIRRVQRKGGAREYTAKILALFNKPAENDPDQTRVRQDSLPEPLTRREAEILELICAGFSNQDIAGKLYLSISTVKNHIHNIYGKLDTNSRAQAVIRAQDLDMIKSTSD